MNTFIPSRRFRRRYDQIFGYSPLAANIFLLMAELANVRGDVHMGPCPEQDIQRLMLARFNDPRAYQLPGGPKR